MVRAVRYLVLLWLAAFVVACGSSPDTDPGHEKKPASILSFEATPASVQPGQSTILSWLVQDAIHVALHDGAGLILDQASLEGSHTVTPEEETTFRLVARGQDGVEVSREVTVSLAPAGGPTVSLVAEPETIAFGGTATLRWESSDATSVVLRAGETVLLDDAERLSGELAVKPTTATIYEITAIGPGGESKASAEVLVEPVIVSFAGPTGRVEVGSSVGLSWKTEGAETLTLRTPEGFSLDIESGRVNSGSAVATVGESGVFELVARNGRVEKIARLEVAILGKPVIASLAATPERLTRGDETSVAISWTIEDATSATLFVGDAPSTLSGTSLTAGSLEVSLDDATTVRLEATNALGTSTRSLEVEAIDAPSFRIFAATPSRVGATEEFSVTWDVAHAETVSLFKGSEALVVDGTETAGNATFSVDTDTTFRLEARNALGAVRSAELLVEIGAPIIDSFEAGAQRHAVGDDLTFTWQVRGGAQIEILDWDREPVAGCSQNGAETGSCTTKIPARDGVQTYTLLATNGAGTTERDLSVIVSDGPWIESFVAAPVRISEGGIVRFSWTVWNDLAGKEPSLVLEDGLGRTVEPTVEDLAKGHVDVTVATPGRQTWTLTASTEGTRDATAVATVDVVPLPEVVAHPNPPTFRLLVDDHIDIEWLTSGAVSLEIFRVGEDGQTGTKIHTAPVGDVEEGSLRVIPSKTNRRWRVVAANELGGTATEDVEVEILDPPAAITSFEASQTQVTPGTSVTLTWVTGGNTTLSPVLGNGPQPIAEGLIPLTNPTRVIFDDCGTSDEDDDGCAAITFPGGFEFPFDGRKHSGAQMFLNGVLSFDMTPNLGRTSTSKNLPASTSSFVHLAPFWTELYQWEGMYRWELRGEGPGRHLVVEWKDVGDYMDMYNHTFQVVLWENGAFDYRYGRIPQYGNEAYWEAVVGFQDLTGSMSHMYKSRNSGTPVLVDTSIRYLEAQEPAVGQRTVVVNKTTLFTLCADGHPDRECRSLTVTVD